MRKVCLVLLSDISEHSLNNCQAAFISYISELSYVYFCSLLCCALKKLSKNELKNNINENVFLKGHIRKQGYLKMRTHFCELLSNFLPKNVGFFNRTIQ